MSTTSLNQTAILSASSLEGDDVRNAEGENLGNIKDVMVNTSTNQIEYYVLSFGGILGMGDKLFAIPPEAIAIDTAEKCFRLNISKDVLEKAEGFDKDNWPNMADRAFRDSIYNHYGLNQRVNAA